MRKVLFTTRAVFQTSPEYITYEAGEIHTLRDDHVVRWVKRGVATDDPAAIAAAEAAKNPPAPEPTPAAATPIRPTSATRNRRDADEG